MDLKIRGCFSEGNLHGFHKVMVNVVGWVHHFSDISTNKIRHCILLSYPHFCK